MLICKERGCDVPVPPSKNPGVHRVFCSRRCSSRYHARAWYQRQEDRRWPLRGAVRVYEVELWLKEQRSGLKAGSLRDPGRVAPLG